MVEIMSKNLTMFRFIEQWTKENPHFPLNQQRTKIFKAGTVQLNNKPEIINQKSKPSKTFNHKFSHRKSATILQRQTAEALENHSKRFAHSRG